MASSSTKKTSSAVRKKTANKSGTRSTPAKRNTRAGSRSGSGKASAQKSSQIGRDLWLLFVIALSLILFLSLFGLIGRVGELLAVFQFGLFGRMAYLFPFLLLILTAFGMSNMKKYPLNTVGRILMAFLTFSIACALAEMIGSRGVALPQLKDYWKMGLGTRLHGGLCGGLWCSLFLNAFGKAGSYVILFVLFLAGLVLTLGRALLTPLGIKGGQVAHAIKDETKRYREAGDERRRLAELRSEERLMRRAEAREARAKAEEEERQALLEQLDRKLAAKRQAAQREKEIQLKEIKLKKEEPDQLSFDLSGTDISKPLLPEDDQLDELVREIEERRKDGLQKEKRTLSELEQLETEKPAPKISQGKRLYTEDLLMMKGVSVSDTEAAGEPAAAGGSSAAAAGSVSAGSASAAAGSASAAASSAVSAATSVPSFLQEEQKDKDAQERISSAYSEYDKSRKRAERKEPRISMMTPPEAPEASKPAEPEQLSLSLPEPSQTGPEPVLPIQPEMQAELPEAWEDPREQLKKISEPVSPRPEQAVLSPKKTVSKNETAGAAAPLTPQEPVRKEYKLPPISLLKRAKSGNGTKESDLKRTAFLLEDTLRNFGVEATVTDISCGPSVTRFELKPEQGVKVSRISSLADDIKLALAATEIRIEAPIPGKSAVGIEVPNPEKQSVSLRTIVESDALTQARSKLSFAVGQDIAGQVVVADLAKMPHLLIAGATGSGKSVCLNSLIISILFRAKPDEVQFIMIDPKVVELRDYNGIPHMRIPVVTDAKLASEALNGAVKEMTGRYKKFADLNVRDIKSYNNKILENPEEYGDREPLPQIVVIVDEFADLMMVAASDVEQAVCRLAQLARAAGIHLVLATQRPSVNVITGLIKANIQSRIALTVSSGVDSRTIIDMNGAEKLLGKGDMLFYPTGYPKPVRVQGCWVSDEEIEAVTDFWKKQADISEEEMAKQNRSWMNDPVERERPEKDERDELFMEAAEYIIDNEKASIGNLQRVFRIGFNRAARLMDQLADAGIVGKDDGTKARQILLNKKQFEDWKRENGYT